MIENISIIVGLLMVIVGTCGMIYFGFGLWHSYLERKMMMEE